MKRFFVVNLIILFTVGSFIFFVSIYAYAATPPVCAPNGCNGVCPAGCGPGQDPDCNADGCCGDSKPQAPNSDGEYEKCDEGGAETESCRADCSQKLLGWAWSANFGWLSLNNKTCSYLYPSLPPETCGPQNIIYYSQSSVDNDILGWAWSDNIGWVCFGKTCNGQGGAAPPGGWKAEIASADLGQENPRIIGWGKILSLGNDGWISLTCENDALACTNSNYQVRLIQRDFEYFPLGNPPTTTEQRLTLNSFAWNGNSSGNGAGWIEFNSRVSPISPWLQTKYSDIYGRRDISGVAPPPGYNATFRILAGGSATNFSSARGLDFWVDPNFGPINFPTPETRYANVLGKLDIDSLLCDFGGAGTCKNQGGKTVVDLTAPGQDLSGNENLGGKIYYSNGDLTTNNPIQFLNGQNFADGSGTIIVNGNLTINADITYDAASGSFTKFRNLASAAWIVKGDLRIDGGVKKLAGNFIVLGNGLSSCEPPVAGCGQIFSCFSGVCSDQLAVSGLMMARRFNFERQYLDQLEGSELIIYDGRLLANTPPGLGDFAQALPIWRSGVFIQ